MQDKSFCRTKAVWQFAAKPANGGAIESIGEKI